MEFGVNVGNIFQPSPAPWRNAPSTLVTSWLRLALLWANVLNITRLNGQVMIELIFYIYIIIHTYIYAMYICIYVYIYVYMCVYVINILVFFKLGAMFTKIITHELSGALSQNKRKQHVSNGLGIFGWYVLASTPAWVCNSVIFTKKGWQTTEAIQRRKL